MRRRILGSLFGVLAIVALTAVAQPPSFTGKDIANDPQSFQKALQNSPEIREAEAKVMLAIAELDKVKLKVSQAIVSEMTELANLQSLIDHAEKELADPQLAKPTAEEIRNQIMQMQRQYRLKLSQFELLVRVKDSRESLPFQTVPKVQKDDVPEVGGSPGGIRLGGLGERLNPSVTIPKIPNPDEENIFRPLYIRIPSESRQKLSKQLNMSIKIPADLEEMSLQEFLKLIKNENNYNLIIRIVNNSELKVMKLNMAEMKLGECLLMVEDSLENQAKFFVRPYGILISSDAPEGAIPLSEYLALDGEPKS